MERAAINSPRLLIRTAENEDDILHLYQYRNNSDYMNLCTNKKKVLSFDEFLIEYHREFTRSRHLQMMIGLKNENKIIGTEFSYGLNSYDGYAFVTIFLEESYRKKGYAPEATISFIEFLFKNFSLHKIYMDVYEFNKLSFHTLEKRGAVIEGVLKEHHIYNGQRHNLYRFAIYRKDSEQIYQSIISACQKLKPPCVD